MTGPLAGVRVVELGSYIAAPFAAQLLADLGAEVLKIEPPGGDGLRSWGAISPSGSSWWSFVQNRGKYLAAVDLRRPEGPGIVRRLLGNVDVLVENMRPGTLDRWGLGPADAAAEFPHLVHVAISGYGLTGPNRELPGFGNIAESLGGLRYVTGFPDRPPVRTGVSLGDSAAALYAVTGAVAALFARERDPERRGDVVDVALTDAVVSLTEAAVTDYVHAGFVRERTGNQLRRAAPSNVYRTADGRWFALGANSDPLFRRLAAAMGEPELAEDPRYRDNQARVAATDDLDARIGTWVGRHTAEQLTAVTRKAGIPAGPVQDVADITRDSHFRERGMIIDVPDRDDPTGAPVTMVGPVPRFERRRRLPEWTGGRVGRDVAVLADWAGIDDDECARLLDAGVLITPATGDDGDPARRCPAEPPPTAREERSDE